MPNILTPVSLWSNFDTSLETLPESVSSSEHGEVVFERLKISGRQTENGRVKIAVAFAYNRQSLSSDAVLIFPDSNKTVDDSILEFFVNHGYCALMVDYRGKWKDCDFYTEYPEDVAYANTAECGRRKDYVDDSADKTSWYEWVAVGLYASKYLSERIKGDKIAVVGVHDGGEIAWQLGVAGNFKCIVPVRAVGWRAYRGIHKYSPEELNLDEERYRFIAGIDSQSYAPNVKCPVLMLCALYDREVDYDRAFDTFSRINSDYISESSIAYSVKCGAGIDSYGVADMFLFLDKNLKNRQVFIPKPPVIAVEADENSNLVARTKFDNLGVVANSRLYLAEDSVDSSLRDWTVCREMGKSDTDFLYFLDVYEKTGTIFALNRVKYSNGFTVWSKMAVKKLSGRFRNNRCKCRVLYTDNDGAGNFFIEAKDGGVGGVFFPDDSVLPRVVTKVKGVKGLYSEYGLSSLRLNNPGFTPSANNLLSLDIFCDENAEFVFTVTDVRSEEEFINTLNIIGGVWQTVILDGKAFKSASGTTLSNFEGDYKITFNCPVGFAINNIMWL